MNIPYKIKRVFKLLDKCFRLLGVVVFEIKDSKKCLLISLLLPTGYII